MSQAATGFLARLKQRKLVQWALAYLAAAWVSLQVLGLAADIYDWPHGFMRIAFAVIALGLVVALVLAWYHGERGAQRVTGTELLILALLLAVGGGLLWRFGRTPAGSPDAAQRNPGKALPDYAAAAASSRRHTVGAQAYLALHRYPEAETQARRVATLNGGDPDAKALLVRGMADPAQRAAAVQALQTSPDNADFRRDAVVHAYFLIKLSERNRALTALENFSANGGSTVPQLLWLPAFDSIRNDPRFKAALKMMGLPYVRQDLPKQ